ncbi:hypothetical protein [Nitrospirillum sp. BR 11163]|uniref:hypothetical protein n=1 Tax=Nitrospirillum sp. BR 11163 TaxID=3104323 RepID=UPI002AFF9496|nr:hypothetical protein [Nitrospirillum sp. BR 11163]MEA1674142.1 hypothetical protein [Nitrospirillum sp. BR 11163]
MSGDGSDQGAASVHAVNAPVTGAPARAGLPAGPTTRLIYRARASLGRRAAIAWTLTLLWLGTAGHRAGAVLVGRGRVLGHRLSLFLTLTGPLALATSLRHWRDRALDHAARRMNAPQGGGARARLRRAWIALAVRVGYALDHQASRLTWRLARTLRLLEREAAGPPRAAPPPRKGQGAPSRLATRLGTLSWGGLEGVAKGLDGAGRLAWRVGTASRAGTGRLLRAALRQGRTLGAASLALLRRFHAHRVRPAIASARQWLARHPPRLARMARAALGTRFRTTLARARTYPWRRLGARLLVPAQCAAGILFGLSLLRRGDTVHMLAGGLLATAFVLMAIIYTWMQAHQPKAETPGPATAEETDMPEPVPVVEMPVEKTIDPPPLAALETVVPSEISSSEAPPPKPRRKRTRRKATASPTPAPPLVGDLATGA